MYMQYETDEQTLLTAHLQHPQEWLQHHLHCHVLVEAPTIALQQVKQVATCCVLLDQNHKVTLLQGEKV